MRTVRTLVCAFVLGLSSLQASVVTFYLSQEFSGADEPKGSAPWLTATLDDSFGDANTVRLTITATNLIDAEFVGGFYLNLNPTFDPLGLTFDLVTPGSNPTGLALGNISQAIDAFKADGDGNYDLLFNFPQPGGAGRFAAGEIFKVDISRVGGLTAQDFVFPEVGGAKGVFYAAAHIQGISILDLGTGQTTASGSGWIGATAGPNVTIDGVAIPEPSTYALLFGACVSGVVALRRSRAKAAR